jgi:hypothetical protein
VVSDSAVYMHLVPIEHWVPSSDDSEDRAHGKKVMWPGRCWDLRLTKKM